MEKQQKSTTEQSQRVPKLRFHEFTGEWEKKKLGDVAEVNPTNKSLPEIFIYVDLESVSKGELFKENEVNKEDAPSRAQRILKENDVLFQMVRPYQMNNLFFNKKGNYVASTGYAQIRTLQNPMFVFQYLHFQRFVDKVIERCTGTSYPAINSTDLSNIEFSHPALPEQSRIASFFTVLDKKITELKQKKNLLEQYKKGLMQKLFPSVSSGQTPELRFKDKDGKEFPDWEKKKLGEVGEIKKGEQLNKEELAGTGSYPCINGGINPSGYTEKFNSLENTITISEGGNSCGYVNYFTFKFWSGGHCYTLKPIDEKTTNNKFLFQLLKQNEVEIKGLRVGSGLPNIQKKDLLEFSLTLPTSIEEQTKITNFLSALDEKINRTENQIQQTQQYKKSLLQNMLV